MPNETKVKVSRSGTDLEVDDKGVGIKVPKGNYHTIRWELDKATLANGKFEPMGIAAAGFAWISSPPDGAFSSPWVSCEGTVLSIENYFLTGAADYIYLLRVRDGANVYTTRVPLVTDPVQSGTQGGGKDDTMRIKTITNPIIINR